MSEESKVIEVAHEEMRRTCLALMNRNNPMEVIFGGHLCNTRILLDLLLESCSSAEIADVIQILRKHELDFIASMCELQGFSVEGVTKIAEGMHSHAMLIRADVRAAGKEVIMDPTPFIKHIIQKGKPHE